jgi:hypothetical protein
VVRADISEEELDLVEAFSPERLGLAFNSDVVGSVPTRPVRKKSPNRIRGAFVPAAPLDWVYRAAVLPGRSLQVALAVWRLAVLRKTPTVGLSTKWLKPWGVDADAKRRALAQLEKAGLIEFVERINGQNPVITIKGL